MNATCASCRAPTEDMGPIGDVVTGEAREPQEGNILVCGACGGLNRYAPDLSLVQAAIEDVIKSDLQDAANVLEAQKRARERLSIITFAECNRKMCFNAGHWRLFFLLKPKGFKGAPIQAGTGLVFCDAHADPNPEQYLTDVGWNQILSGFDAARRARPHRSSTEVQFLALDSEEVLRFDKVMRSMKKEAVH